jgi:hypothetical protein
MVVCRARLNHILIACENDSFRNYPFRTGIALGVADRYLAMVGTACRPLLVQAVVAP